MACHLLSVSRRNLVIRHGYSDNRPRHPLGWDKDPRPAVAGGVEPRAVLERVITVTVDEEIEVNARDVGDGTIRYDDDGWRRRQ